MIHQAWSAVRGRASEMRSEADALDRLNANAAKVYAARSGKSEDEMAALMESDKWISADEAVEFGLADEVSDPKAVAAKVARIYTETRMADEEKPDMADEETPKAMPEDEEGMKAEGGEGAEVEMADGEDEVDGNSIVEQYAQYLGLSKAATVALLTDKMDPVAAILNEAAEVDGSESEAQAADEITDEEKPDAGMALQNRILMRRIQKLEAEDAKRQASAKAKADAAAEAALDKEVQDAVDAQFVLDGERDQFRKLLKADPETTRAMFATKRVPEPKADAEPAAKPAAERKLEDLSERTQRVARNLIAAKFRGGDMKACIAKAIEQETN